MKRWLCFLSLFLIFNPCPGRGAEITTDVCVYGATPSGLLAAEAVAREGRSVVIIEPSRWVGGILGAGLKPVQDCPNPDAVGGLTRKLLDTLGQPEGKILRAGRINPEDIRRDFLKLLQEKNIQVLYNQRVSRCEKEGGTIRKAFFDYAPYDELGCPPAIAEKTENLSVEARIFIDASYEGDLMAAAGVSYRCGRESVSEFHEEFAGIREPVCLTPIDPYVEPGNPSSGLLKLVEDGHSLPVGSADKYTQAYNYRFYVTDDPTRRAPITPPTDYNAADYELVGRYVEYLKSVDMDETSLMQDLARIFPGWKNAGEYNYHRESLITMAPVGVSREYADGDYAAKAGIWKLHQNYLRGLHHFLSTDPRVPAAFRKKTASLGLDVTHHPDTQGWPHQLYIRVTRRMIGRYTISAADVYNQTRVDDPVCLTQYGIDVYPCRRIVTEKEGKRYVALEGWMFVGGEKGPTQDPYPVSYRALTPRAEECVNLLVPVCFSATHLGYASARMEPAFMMCGEAAGLAACQALDQNVAVQDIDMSRYEQTLKDAGMVFKMKAAEASSAGRAKERDEGADRKVSASEGQSFLKECDQNGDQKVSASEWGAAKKGWGWAFPILDLSKDGYLEVDEYEQFQQYKTQHPNWQKKMKSSYP